VWAGDEPYEKLDRTVGTDSVEPLVSTFVPIERDALWEAAAKILSFHRERVPRSPRHTVRRIRWSSPS
jgi:hypothetical protein